MRPGSRYALALVSLATVLVAPGAASARPQGTPECSSIIPAPPAPYSCHFAHMPQYSQSDPNLAFITVPQYIYESELTNVACTVNSDCEGSSGWQYCGQTDGITPCNGAHPCHCTAKPYGSPGVNWPYAQSWMPAGPLAGDIGSIGWTASNNLCGATAEAMALAGALAYRSPHTHFTGEYCVSTTNCPAGYACNNHTCTPVGAYCYPGFQCPTGYLCSYGVCVVDACNPSPCPSGYDCVSGTCTPDIYSAQTLYLPTALQHNSPGTYNTFSFNQGTHSDWSWDCSYYPDQSAALDAPTFNADGSSLQAYRGFVGSPLGIACVGGAPLDLWPPSTYPGTVGLPPAPPHTVYGLQQIVSMSLFTGGPELLTPDYLSMAPFAAEFYNNAADGASCSYDTDCSPGYCLNASGSFHVQAPFGPHGTCSSAAYQTLTTWEAVTGWSPSIAITTAGLRAVIDRGGTGAVAQTTWNVKFTGYGTTNRTLSFPAGPADTHFVALQGYDVSYDSGNNPIVQFTYNNPAYGLQERQVLVDLAAGTFTSGATTLQVTLPKSGTNVVTNAAIWPFEVATGRVIQSVWDIKPGDQLWMADAAYFIYVQ